MNKKEWLDAATKKIIFRPDRKAVRKELEAHFEDLLESSGLEEEAALEAMGDPEAVAVELGRLHRPWLGYLWRASQLALIGAAAMYCLLLVMLVWTGRAYLLPGNRLYEYQHWLGSKVVRGDSILEERDFLPEASIETGGYTIRVDRALLRKEDFVSKIRWNLYIDLDITLSRWEEPLDYWFAVSGGRASTGPVETGSGWSASAGWGFWQKCVFVIEDFPEDAEWVELDFGRGELKRTLHIDLLEEAET